MEKILHFESQISVAHFGSMKSHVELEMEWHLAAKETDEEVELGPLVAELDW